jgi:hypothetical protein
MQLKVSKVNEDFCPINKGRCGSNKWHHMSYSVCEHVKGTPVELMINTSSSTEEEPNKRLGYQCGVIARLSRLESDRIYSTSHITQLALDGDVCE